MLAHLSIFVCRSCNNEVAFYGINSFSWTDVVILMELPTAASCLGLNEREFKNVDLKIIHTVKCLFASQIHDILNFYFYCVAFIFVLYSDECEFSVPL